MSDRVEFDGEDDDAFAAKDPRAVTCRYDMKKLRQIGEVSIRSTIGFHDR